MGEIFRAHRDTNIVVAVIDSATEQPVGSPTRIKRNEKKSIKQQLLKCYGNFNLISKEVKERNRTPLERIIWFLIFMLCFSYCGYLIWKSYTKWSRSPAIVLLTENSESILKIPFPAVTVCPQRKINENQFSFKRYKELYKNNKTYGNFTEHDLHLYEDLDLICDHNTGLKGRKSSLGNEIVRNIRKVSTKLSDVLLRCQWKGRSKSCEKLFSPVLTEEGICYTFNLIGPEDMFRSTNLNTDYGYVSKSNRTRIKGWSPENGYEKNLKTKYPERSYGAGAKVGLSLTLGEREEGLDMTCMGMVSGFKLLLHNPTSLPRLSQQYIRIPIYEETTVAFTPEKIITSDGLRDFRPERRQCYYTEERSLKYFKLYTQTNCDIECLSNFTYARCGCVVFSMPHAPDMEICNLSSQNCTSFAEFDLAVWNVNRKISSPGRGNTSIEDATRIADDCKCLPTCTSVLYESEISQLELEHTDRTEYSLHDFLLTGNLTRFKVSNVVIFFKRALVDISKRSELYGTADILASCGGLLGLFMGFSVINIIETLYFCILRTYQQGRTGDQEKEVIQQENITY